jgi:hypothetical protein
MPYGLVYETSKGSYLSARNDTILVQDKPGVFVKQVEDMFNEKHRQSYEGSMSALINGISFQYVEVELPEDIKQVIAMFVPDEGTTDKFSITRISNVAGSVSGIKLKPEEAKKLIENGKKPRLISI